VISQLKALFSSPEENSAHDPEQQKRLACAALMVEVATIDRHFDEREMATLQAQLHEQFDIPEALSRELCEEAKKQRDSATSLYPFTHWINESCSPEEKYRIILGMWAVAYADGDLDKYEEYLIRRAADLIYVSHSDFIRAKLEAREKRAP